ncbi:MAG: hypothetical protein BWK80_17475 [Desulfobacteraceae bacterium IS3]|nr:MAG: hypothetical protein BWK80_17475 [Desulfobacteraceae bacterium IS3]
MENNFDDITRVLLVDDEEGIEEGSARIISQMGYETFKASRGEEIFRILRMVKISIVLLDLRMSGIDGLEVLGLIHEKYPAVSVIAVSESATVDIAIAAMKGGAYDFIAKPFEPDHLRTVLTRAVEKLRLERVLIVDDEEGIREGSARIITRMGCKVFKASRGEEALEILEKEKVSIILLDLKMPGMDGMEVLNRIQRKDKSILVIIITGFATVDTAVEAMRKGAYDFIPKPFEPDHLRMVINRAREKLRLEQEAGWLAAERKKNLADLDTEKSRIRTVIEFLPGGLAVTNVRGYVVLMNPAFLRRFDLNPNLKTGLPIENYVKDEGFCKYIREISQGKYKVTDEIPAYEIALPNNKFLMARGRPVPGEEASCVGAAVALTDITSMKMLDQLKSEFVAKVSHELRSPLSTIHEQLALVLSDIVKEGKDPYLLVRAKEKTRGLISLIGDLLDLSRIESGMLRHDPKPVCIDDLLKSIVDFMETNASAKHQSLVLEIIGMQPFPPITADPISVESIFGNLIANAINYTPENGKIKIRAELVGEPDSHRKIRVAVADNGFGIEAKYFDKIFDRFFRVKNEKTRYITGTGLGLPIVKSLTEAMGGTIAVESEPDRGTTFTVTLPLDKA